MSKTISIEIFNNTAFSSNEKYPVVRSNNESIDIWIKKILDTFIINKSQNVFIDIVYPINPFIENISLTKLISMQAISKIANIANLNILSKSAV